MAVTTSSTGLTAADFFAMESDGKAYELIDGELREMTTPNIGHQRITFRLSRTIEPEATRVGGEVFCPGVGVVVEEAIVQVPDIVVVTRPIEQTNLEYGLITPPDLVIEILSPSTARNDRTDKKDRYEAFGVRELWLVSPEARTIEIFALDADGRYALHARVGLDEPVSSTVLPGLSFPASAAFVD